ncbi:MAG: hypothetical protein AB1757_01060 [Acidobacteriota bacterium]
MPHRKIFNPLFSTLLVGLLILMLYPWTGAQTGKTKSQPKPQTQATPAIIIFDNWNRGAVSNHPSQATRFTISQPHLITLIRNYHWNNGKGAVPRTIGLRDDKGNRFGPWQCKRPAGKASVASTHWECQPYDILPAGVYEVIDAEPMSWSYNGASQGSGFSRIEGEPLDEPLAPQVEAASVKTFEVNKSKTAQNIGYQNRVTVTLPPGLLGSKQKVTIGEIPKERLLIGDYDYYFMPIDGFGIAVGDKREFKEDIVIEIPYNPADLNPKYRASQQITAYHWDERQKMWLPVSSTVDEANRKVTIRTRHLSFFSFEWTAWGLAKITGAIAAGAAIAYVGHIAYEKKALDTFSSSNSNFNILYSASDINGAASPVNNAKWNVQNPGSGASRAHPRYIVDLGAYLETAFSKYKILGVPATPIIVKVNSYYIKGWNQNPAFYESRWTGRIHVDSAKTNSPTRLQHKISHELFHAFQYAFLNQNLELWWKESTADYAACRFAANLRDQMGHGLNDIHPKLLTFPLSDTGIKDPPATLSEIEYDKGYFIEYLVAKGADFAAMCKEVAAASTPATFTLDRYLRKTTVAGLDSHYRGFAGYFLLNADSPINRRGAATVADGGLEKTDIFKLGANKNTPAAPIQYQFQLAQEYTAKAWGVKAEVRPPSTTRQLNARSVGQELGAYVDLYVLKNNQAIQGNAKPTATLIKKGEMAVITLGASDMLYVVAVNINPSQSGSAAIQISDADIALEIEPVETKLGKFDYKFKAKAQPIPPTMNKLAYQWNFGDKSDSFTDKYSGGFTNQTIAFSKEHKFPGAGKYLISVELFDVSKGIRSLIAKATLPITLTAKPDVEITPDFVSGDPPKTVTFRAVVKNGPAKPYFVWTIDNVSRSSDKEETIATTSATLTKKFIDSGSYEVKVKLYNNENRKQQLDADSAYLNLIAAAPPTPKPQPPTPQPAPPKPAPKEEKRSGYWKFIREEKQLPAIHEGGANITITATATFGKIAGTRVDVWNDGVNKNFINGWFSWTVAGGVDVLLPGQQINATGNCSYDWTSTQNAKSSGRGNAGLGFERPGTPRGVAFLLAPAIISDWCPAAKITPLKGVSTVPYPSEKLKFPDGKYRLALRGEFWLSPTIVIDRIYEWVQ